MFCPIFTQHWVVFNPAFFRVVGGEELFFYRPIELEKKTENRNREEERSEIRWDAESWKWTRRSRLLPDRRKFVMNGLWGRLMQPLWWNCAWHRQILGETGHKTHLLVFSSLSHTHKFTWILISNTGILAGENLNKCTHSTQENKSVLRLFIMLIKFTHWNVNRFQRPRVHCGPYLHIMNNACCSSPVLLQRLLRTLFVVSEGNHDTWH